MDNITHLLDLCVGDTLYCHFTSLGDHRASAEGGFLGGRRAERRVGQYGFHRFLAVALVEGIGRRDATDTHVNAVERDARANNGALRRAQKLGRSVSTCTKNDIAGSKNNESRL